MTKKYKIKKLNKKQQKTLHEHLDHHVCRYYHKHFHIAHHSHHHFAHIGELIVVVVLGCMSRIFAGNVWLPSNNWFVYPLKEISSIECRTEHWNNMNPSCKLMLPRITNANYETYKESQRHRQIYTVLRAAPYSAWWDQTAWAHAWIDIATARWTPLYSIGDGEVTYAGRQNGYGNVVKIKYLFKWQYIHAVYGHMDMIQVQAWQRVSAGQQIGTVGNSGTTFGALGGFHLHLEITKDNRGRPMYAYSGCEDLSKWHRTIIQNWLCREELLANQYDPIVLFEQNRLGHVIAQQTIADRWNNNDTETEIKQEEKAIQTEIPTVTIDPKPVENETIDPTLAENNIQNPIESSDTMIENKNTIPTIIETPIKEETIVSTELQTPLDWRKGEKITVNIDWLSEEIQHFFKTHELYIHNHTENNNIAVWWSKDIEINFYRRWSDNKFIGVLPFTIEILPSQKNIATNIHNLQLISPNPTTIQIRWTQNGNSTLLLSIDGNTIHKIAFTIN
jgi:hypothetical protein